MSDLTVEDAGMHRANMVRGVVSGIHESLQKYQAQTENPTIVQAPVDHVANVVQKTQKKLATQLQQMKLMMQTTHMNYNAVPHGTRQDYGIYQYYVGRGYHDNQSSYRG